MSLFGKKKLSLEEILKGVESLSEEEKAKVLAKIQGEPESSSAPDATETEAPISEEEEESVGIEESPSSGESEPVTEAPTEEMPMETPQTEETEDPAGTKYDELIAEQNAKILSLESQIAAMKETIEKIVSNQDNKNFGYSPKANFDDDAQLSQRDAIYQSYAPRRADQYK